MNDIFRKTRPVFITVTSGGKGTSVYIDGEPIKNTPRLRLSTAHFTARLVVTDAPGQTDSWRGRLLGLAIYHRQLEAFEVIRHFSTWTLGGQPTIAENERNVALYLFQEHKGNVAHDSTRLGLHLQIPERYMTVDKIFLEPFWQEFELSQSYWSAVVKNVIGFVPFGFCFYTYLIKLRVKRATLATVILGTIVSVTIEVVQAYLPTRDSGTSDIFTNTFGAWIGVASYSLAVPRLPKPLSIVFTAADSRQSARVTDCERN